MQRLKKRVGKSLYGCFLGVAMMMAVAGVGLGPILNSQAVYAEPETVEIEEAAETEDGSEADVAETAENETTEAETTGAETTTVATAAGASCKDNLGALGWLVCPMTEKVAEAVDWLYDKIEEILLIDPVEMKDGEPIYELWKYFRGITNIVFIIFLLVVIWSQLTGIGISNYGIKRTLPKLIVAAVLVNLSYLICALAVDVSNIIGNGLRSVLDGIEVATMGAGAGEMTVSMTDTYAALAGGGLLAVGAGAIAIESGAIWMLIPTVLGAIVAVASGLITIALRQAVVALLVMISPLAMVAYMLPNTEQWFKKWRQLLMKMLVFYPMFSLLFAAANLAGWAIMMGAKSGFMVLLGLAVQIFPLFFSWSLMRMSGTFLNTVNGWMRGMAARPLMANRAWADSHREMTRQKYLASQNAFTPSLRLMQFLSNRRIAREGEIKENASLVQARGEAYIASRHYKNGLPTREAEQEYERQARILEYQRTVLNDKNNFNKGLGQLEAVKNRANRAQIARLGALDTRIVNASDYLKIEQARTEKIDYDNAVGFHKRMEEAVNAHFDTLNADKATYKQHFDRSIPKGLEAYNSAYERYQAAQTIMEGNVQDVQFSAATAAAAYDTQAKIVMSKMQKYFELTPPTKDVEYRLKEFSQYEEALKQWQEAKRDGVEIDPYKRIKATNNIDAIVSGLRIINQRGDTDIVKGILDDLIDEQYGGVELGTHASQSLASFLMFDVGDNDPFLKRMGKFINLETARAYNKNERQEMNVTFDEYIKGYHMERNPKTGEMERFYAKKSMIKLLEGTSFDRIERTAMDNMDDSIKMAYGYDPEDKSKEWDRKGWLDKLKETMTAIEPQFLSANQKFLSGSEQMGSFVKFWSGYTIKPRMKQDPVTKEQVYDLDENGDQIFDFAPIWGGKEFAGFEDELRGFYEKNMTDFYKDQTTAQVLNSRTDWRGPTAEHLLNTYLTDEKASPEERAARKLEYEQAQASILEKYSGDISDSERKQRDKELEDLKLNTAAIQLRKILGETGKLKQIYRTRRGGTAIGSKDWFRRMVHLDDEDLLYEEVKYYDRLRKEAREKSRSGADSPEEDGGGSSRIYDEDFQHDRLTELSDTFEDMKDDSPEVFYETTLEMVQDWFGADSSVVELKYKKYYDDYKDTITAEGLYRYLTELMEDMDNYPDAPLM